MIQKENKVLFSITKDQVVTVQSENPSKSLRILENCLARCGRLLLNGKDVSCEVR